MDLPNYYREVDRKDDPQSITVDVDRPKTTCWGCGRRLSIASDALVFKCRWCGAITKQFPIKNDDKHLKRRRLRDHCFVFISILFMVLFICGGVWAVYPIIFSISYFCGVFHLTVAAILSLSTLSSFCLAAFKPAGVPPLIPWGGGAAVRKGGLEDHTFCHQCSKPKSPKTHHCGSCGTCVLDMDHHCPFIGNCVGSENHKAFVVFLICAAVSLTYIAIMASYSALCIWPAKLPSNGLDFLNAALFLPARGFVLIYFFLSSVSVGSGVSVLLWQQLWFVYTGKTYLRHLSSTDAHVEKDCDNLVRFFGCTVSTSSSYLPSYWKSRKRHGK